MIPELAHLAAAFALGVACLMAALGLWGGHRSQPALLHAVSGLAQLQLALLLGAFALLAAAFLQDDFSVLYIAENSNSSLPWYYKISAIWGAHEGSFLLWTLVMSAWTSAVAWAGGRLASDTGNYVLGTMGLINAHFLLYLLLASNPFLRLVPNVPVDGADLNPVLQDFGQIVHPPMLYVGWLGFSVAFSLAVAALLTRRLDDDWANLVRPWCYLAWASLTVGIALGSWCAYHELGWGGWWFWDPVENASFMPWLAGTALMHSLAVVRKRNGFHHWAALLCLVTFSLCLAGAFLVRSGVLTCVHAIASDPTRGVMLLAILCLVAGGSQVINAVRYRDMKPPLGFELLARETLLLINNLLLMTALGTVFVGTMFPLVYEALSGGGRLSVGPPYFNRVFLPIMCVLVGFLALAPILRWRSTPASLAVAAWKPLVMAAAAGVAIPLLVAGWITFAAVAAYSLAGWVIWTHVADLARRRRSAVTIGSITMIAGHLGFAVAVLALASAGPYSHVSQVRMAVGDSAELNGRRYTLAAVEDTQGPNYLATRGRFEVEGRFIEAEKRLYTPRDVVTTEGGIGHGLFRDLYVSMGEPFDDGSWGVQLQEKPLIRWIWAGAMIVAIAGILAAFTSGRLPRAPSFAGESGRQQSKSGGRAATARGHATSGPV
ncbi:MAG: heme lyase CcmF/NrfE family subunit [Pseudomonadales bacterium]|nr:heme lyase CcmF/NrfE family subunit [Pseudomonadales bacterium]